VQNTQRPSRPLRLAQCRGPYVGSELGTLKRIRSLRHRVCEGISYNFARRPSGARPGALSRFTRTVWTCARYWISSSWWRDSARFPAAWRRREASSSISAGWLDSPTISMARLFGSSVTFCDLAAFRADPGKTAPARPRLNDSQQEILRLLTEGLSNKEIASRIHLSENTVKTHIQEILRRLEVRNRVQAAVRATKERWV
jgi:DNA-binding CsgD family transcriptional regulator